MDDSENSYSSFQQDRDDEHSPDEHSPDSSELPYDTDSDNEEIPDMKIGWDDETRVLPMNDDMARIFTIIFKFVPYADTPYHGRRVYTRATYRERGEEEKFNQTNSVQVRPKEPGFFEYQFCWTQPDEEERQYEETDRFWLFFSTTNPFKRSFKWSASIQLGIDSANMETGGIIVSTLIRRRQDHAYRNILFHEETITSPARLEQMLETIVVPVMNACELLDVPAEEDSEKSTDVEDGDADDEEDDDASDMELD